MENISIGDEIKDGFKKTEKWVKANISFISEMEAFYKQRALIEREYSDKLGKLCTESYQTVTKLSPVLSVGEDPTITPGSLECASVVAWKEVLIQTENISKEKRSLASKFESDVAASLNKVGTKYAAIKDKWKGFDDELTTLRDKNFNEMNLKKKLYDQSCESMESQRAKSLKSSSDKIKEKLAKKESEMNIAKNNYLLTISTCNRLKDKYYYQDTPELLDGLQDLNEAKVSKINSIWLSSSILEKESNERITKFVDSIDVVIKQNLPKLDTAMFVKHNLKNWIEPVDFNYIPSTIWHDDETMITEDQNALYDLKIKLNNACSTYENYNRICNDEKQEVEELLVQRNKLVGDTFNEVQIKSPEDYQVFEDLLVKSINVLQKFTNDDTKRVMSEVEIETIQNVTDGIDMAITTPIHKEKKSKFGFLKFKHHDSQQNDDDDGDGYDEIQSLSENVNSIKITSTNSKLRMFNSLGQAMNNVIDAYNTPVNQKAPSLDVLGGGGMSRKSTISTMTTTVAKALYAYEPQGDDELNMVPNETFSIVQQDDGSGWTVVSNASKAEGLVPTSYLKIETIQTASSPVKKQGPKVAPRRNAKLVKRMQVLYDYQSQGDDELNVSKGDTVIVIQEDDGSGWTEAELNGVTGLFPTSYAKNI